MKRLGSGHLEYGLICESNKIRVSSIVIFSITTTLDWFRNLPHQLDYLDFQHESVNNEMSVKSEITKEAEIMNKNIKLIAVSKTKPEEDIIAAYEGRIFILSQSSFFKEFMSRSSLCYKIDIRHVLFILS